MVYGSGSGVVFCGSGFIAQGFRGSGVKWGSMAWP